MFDVNRRKLGSIEALRAMENHLKREAEALKASIPKRVAAAKRSAKVPAGTNVP